MVVPCHNFRGHVNDEYAFCQNSDAYTAMKLQASTGKKII